MGQKTIRLSSFFFTGFATIAMLAVLIPDVRTQVRSTIQPKYRTVLSTVSGDVLGAGADAKVLKVKTHDGLFVEVYSTDKNQPKLVQKLKLVDQKDGYFMFNGEAANLVLDDVDGDKTVEILVPSFDKDLVAKLNIFTFNKSSNKFVKIN